MAIVFAMCAFPTTFIDLWHVATVCSIVLIVTTCVIFWRRHALKSLRSALLMGVTLVGGLWSLALAVVTSRNVLVCAGVPGAGADLIQRADESYQTLLAFQSVVTATVIAALLLVLISAFSLYITWGRGSIGE